MSAYSRHSTSRPAYDAYGAEGLQLDLEPADRVGAPLDGRRGRRIRKGLLLLGVAGAGWLHYNDPALLPGWWRAASDAWVAVRGAAPPPASGGEAPARLAALEPASPPATVAPPEPDARPASPQPGEPAEAAPAAGDPAPSQASAEPPPAPPPEPITDPYQKRAEAVGLHPDLSPTLLEKLSETDYRNAGVAIRKALAETDDDAVLVWPRQGKPGLAQFKVHFVAGAGQSCRRYVVTVAKEGWLTTALPMERCGVKRTKPQQPEPQRPPQESRRGG